MEDQVKKWFYAFMNRNSHIINQRVETTLELKRSQVTKEKMDAWYDRFRNFLLSIGLIDKPSKIWNADETGFNMGSNKSKVIGPTRRDLGVPHISFGKQSHCDVLWQCLWANDASISRLPRTKTKGL